MLLVEGDFDLVCLREVLAAHGRSRVQIGSLSGKASLPSKIEAWANAPGFQGVDWFAVARDADSDPVAAFASIQEAFRRAQARRPGLVVPALPWQAAGANPVTAAVVFPDGRRQGDIETLIWDALGTEPAAPCVQAYVDCLAGIGLAPNQESKTRVYAFLASLGRPDWSLGIAGRARRLPMQSSVFLPLIALLPPDDA